MKGIRRYLGALAFVFVSLHTLMITVGVASCCLNTASHHAAMPEYCPMVHAEGETCPMHGQESASPVDSERTSTETSEACFIGCAPGSTPHALLQTANGGPVAATTELFADFVATALPFDAPPQTLDPGGRPFSPPPRG